MNLFGNLSFARSSTGVLQLELLKNEHNSPQPFLIPGALRLSLRRPTSSYLLSMSLKVSGIRCSLKLPRKLSRPLLPPSVCASELFVDSLRRMLC